MAIFLHAGSNRSVKSRDIVGIFDMDTSTVSRVTRDFLNKAQKKGIVEIVTQDIPKAYILTFNKKERKPRGVITQASPQTLKERLKRKIQ